MPFLRVIRDKRGYETTYLMHLYREGSRQRSRILYVFRTPGDVRVGRSSLEPETLRQIEKQYPGIEFDWTVVIGNQQVVESAPDLRRPRKRRPDEAETTDDVPPVQARVAQAVSQPPAIERGVEVAEAPPSRPAIPASIQGDTPDDKIAFLAHWYAACRQRILQRTADAERNEGLLALAERLNPATWTDADQITAGLLQAAEALERLSHVFGKRRRRPRRGSGRVLAHGESLPAEPDALEQSSHVADLEPSPGGDLELPAPDAVESPDADGPRPADLQGPPTPDPVALEAPGGSRSPETGPHDPSDPDTGSASHPDPDPPDS